MSRNTIAFIGNSVTGGTFASSVRYGYPMQLTRMIRGSYPAWARNIVCMEESVGGYFGNMWELWESIRGMRPSIVCLNIGDNDVPATPPTQITATASQSQTEITFDHAPLTQLYRLYAPSTGDEEWIYVRQVSSSTGKQIRRGLFGTRPRIWVAGSTVVANDAGADKNARFTGGTNWLDQAEKLVGAILGPKGGDYHPLVLAGGMWYYGGSGTRATIDLLQNRLDGVFGDRPNYKFVPFVDSDGLPLYETAANRGPTALLEADCADVDATCTINIDDEPKFDIGNYALLTTATGLTAPVAGNSEIVKITAKDGLGTLDITRGRLGSSARSFVTGNRLCRLSVAQASSQGPIWATLGGAGFDSSMWHYDDHPNDTGHWQIANCYKTAFDAMVSKGA